MGEDTGFPVARLAPFPTRGGGWADSTMPVRGCASVPARTHGPVLSEQREGQRNLFTWRSSVCYLFSSLTFPLGKARRDRGLSFSST